MKTIIAGSRDITDYSLLLKAIETCGWKITEVVSGCADGVDKLGERWAQENHIPVMHFPADWERLGRRAGPLRNGYMAVYGEALIAITNGSRGTSNMIKQAAACGLKIKVVMI